MPTPVGTLVDQTAIVGDAWVVMGIIITAMSTFVALALGIRVGPRLLRKGISFFRG